MDENKERALETENQLLEVTVEVASQSTLEIFEGFGSGFHVFTPYNIHRSRLVACITGHEGNDRTRLLATNRRFEQ